MSFTSLSNFEKQFIEFVNQPSTTIQPFNSSNSSSSYKSSRSFNASNASNNSSNSSSSYNSSRSSNASKALNNSNRSRYSSASSTTSDDDNNQKNKKIVQVCAGENFSLLLDSEGNVYGMGSNDKGQLGIGDTIDRHTPCMIDRESFYYKKIVQIAVGKKHCVALTECGSVFWWGNCRYDAIDPHDRQCNIPCIIDASNFSFEPISYVQTNAEQSFFVTQKNELYAYTRFNGELIDYQGNTIDKSTISKIIDESLYQGEKIVDICSFYEKTFLLTESGKVYSFNSRENRRYWARNGRPANIGFMLIDPSYFYNEKVKQISGSSDVVSAVTFSGRVYVWGRLYDPLFPNSVQQYYDEPMLVDSNKFGNEKVKFVCQTVGVTRLITESSNGYIFETEYASIFNTPEEYRFPNKVRSLDTSQINHEKVCSFACGQNTIHSIHHIIATESGKVYVMGNNDCGQLGLGDFEIKDKFTRCDPSKFGVKMYANNKMYVNQDYTDMEMDFY